MPYVLVLVPAVFTLFGVVMMAARAAARADDRLGLDPMSAAAFERPVAHPAPIAAEQPGQSRA